MDKTKIIKILSISIVVILLVIGGFFAYQKFKTVEAPIVEPKKDDQVVPQNDQALPVISNDQNLTINNGEMLTSENFKINQVKFGGDAGISAGDLENLPIEISEVHSESFATKKGDEAKLVVSWKSNKMTIADVEYSKSNGQNAKVSREVGYGFTHSVILPDLDPGQAYMFRIIAKDRWGNEKSSNFFGAYVSSRPISVFEMIGIAAQDIFGWAIKK